jgi:hypothetical protein
MQYGGSTSSSRRRTKNKITRKVLYIGIVVTVVVGFVVSMAEYGPRSLYVELPSYLYGGKIDSYAPSTDDSALK